MNRLVLLILVLAIFLCLGSLTPLAARTAGTEPLQGGVQAPTLTKAGGRPATLPPPTLSRIDPVSGVRESVVNVTLTGTNFVAGLVVNAGFGIAVTNVQVLDSATATADFAINANAPLGVHNVTVTTDSGVGALNTFTVLPPPPTFSGISPASGSQGATLSVTLSGTNFVLGLTVDAGTDITVRSLSIRNATTVTASFSIAADAVLGARDVIVTTRGGTSEALPFTVVGPAPPTLTSISPASGVQDAKVSVTLTGTDFGSDLAVDAISGIAVTNTIVVNSTTATATFSIAADAAVGARNVTVTTSHGTSQAATFTIAGRPPKFSGIDPAAGVQGAVVSVVLSGSDFTSGLSVNAVPGIAVTDISVTDSSSAAATFTIDAAAALGPRGISVTTPGGTSATVTFTVNPPPPTLTGITPASGLRNTTFDVTLTGTNFVDGLLIDAGTDIKISKINVTDSTTATATFAIGAAADPGLRNITITTAGGTAAAASFTVVPPPPTLTKIDPAKFVQKKFNWSEVVTLTGTNFFSPTINVGGTGVTASNVQIISTTSATAILTVAANTDPGDREVTVTTDGGTSSVFIITVLPPAPTLTSIDPAIGVKGTSVSVILTGTNFVAGATTVDSIPGVTISDTTVVNESSLKAVFTIAPGAQVGARNVTVTTPVDTSTSVSFVVNNPFPDLSISSAPAGRFGVGFNEAYTVAVTNVGTLATTGAITVNNTLPVGLTFVSGTGTGWSCSAAGQAVNCGTSTILAPSESSSFTLTVAVDSRAAATVNHTVLVKSAGDLNPANDAMTDLTTVAQTPSPNVVITPSPPVAGQQATAAVRLPSLFPHDVTGSLTLTFAPKAVIPLDDPAIQLETGGRTVAFTIPANQAQAIFESASKAGVVGFQPGTVAGTLTFRGTFTVGGVDRNLPPTSAAIPLQPPSIQSIQTSSQGGFVASILLSATSREVTALNLAFNTTPSVKPSCGTLAGCTVSGNTLTFDVSAFFATWYANDTTFGSLSLLRLPFTIQGGTAKGTVAVTLQNNQGVSNSMSFTLP